MIPREQQKNLAQVSLFSRDLNKWEGQVSSALDQLLEVSVKEWGQHMAYGLCKRGKDFLQSVFKRKSSDGWLLEFLMVLLQKN